MIAAWQKLKFGRAFLKLVNDPEQTEEVFNLAEVGLRGKDTRLFKPILERAFSHPEFKEIFESGFVAPEIDLTKLEALPEGTLGRAYARHMLERGLDPNFYRRVEPTQPIFYIALRARQTHDIWHVLTGYDTTVKSELALQGFTFAQIGSGVSVALLAAGLLHFLKTKPEDLRDVMDAIVSGYERGRRARYLLATPWEKFWEMPLRDAQTLAGLH